MNDSQYLSKTRYAVLSPIHTPYAVRIRSPRSAYASALVDAVGSPHTQSAYASASTDAVRIRSPHAQAAFIQIQYIFESSNILTFFRPQWARNGCQSKFLLTAFAYCGCGLRLWTAHENCVCGLRRRDCGCGWQMRTAEADFIAVADCGCGLRMEYESALRLRKGEENCMVW